MRSRSSIFTSNRSWPRAISIIATPTLLKNLPLPLRQMFGDLSDTKATLRRLGIADRGGRGPHDVAGANHDHLLVENQELRSRLEEAEELLHCDSRRQRRRAGDRRTSGPQVYTLEGADQPYRIYVETMNEGAVTLSQDGTILYCNRQFAELYRSLH